MFNDFESLRRQGSFDLKLLTDIFFSLNNIPTEQYAYKTLVVDATHKLKQTCMRR